MTRDHVGQLLKSLRESSRISQLELALRLNVSQRHVSFVESGRARPSRGLIENWASETEAPPSLCNAALHRAGYTPLVGGVTVDNGGLAETMAALQTMLDMHEPFAGLVFDADWIAHLGNRASHWLIMQLLPDYRIHHYDGLQGFDMIAAVTHKGGLLSRMRDPWGAGGALLDQLRDEQWVRPALKPRVDAYEASLHQRFGRRPEGGARRQSGPYLNLIFDTCWGEMRFLTVQSVFALPQDVTLTSLRTELWFPADEATRHLMQTQPTAAGDAPQRGSEREEGSDARERAAPMGRIMLR
ncbi:helix-turn-helix domain-containing protein [Sphingopyxis sp. MWB1]|uniref:helix-turn-helix domain-containing protein n=1 Tax=Sphingopyxis sp. MWB1 TaxID=1537715 RepID=UPI00051A24B6|nr:helix-turn-helix transcriptional regulator [Sphingopyxis sp. MWB1]